MGNCIRTLFKSPYFYIALTALTCLSLNAGINVSIVYLYFFLIEKFLEDYLYLKYLLILILFIYNYLILRRIVRHWIYEWQFPFQIFSIYKERQNYLNYLKERINGFLNSLDVLLNKEYKLTLNEIDEINYFFAIFDDEFYIYDNLYSIVFTNNGMNNNNLIRYKMSQKQVNYYNLLKAIENILNQNDLRNKLKTLKPEENCFERGENIDDLIRLRLGINELLPVIEKYSLESYAYMSPAYICNLLFNDTFGSLSLYSLQFKKNFQEFSIEENYSPSGKIHYTLIRNTNQNNNNNIISNSNKIEIEGEDKLIPEKTIKDDGTLLFFCLPNGGCYELIPKSKIQFYLINGFSFLCWNYRGYGYSKGIANFSNCKSDALEVFDAITKNPKYNFRKICVMGHSIGGVAISHIIKNRKVDLAISDRNFCDLPRIVKNFHCGNVLSFLTKCLLIGNSYIVEDFLSENINYNVINEINRLVVYSPSDNLLQNDSSMKSGISRAIIKNYIIYKSPENNAVIKSKENFLDLVFNSNEKDSFLNNLIELFQMNRDKALDNLTKDDFFQNEYEKNLDKKNNNVSFEFFNKFVGICPDDLGSMLEVDMSQRRQKLYLESFFNNLLIWGAQGEEILNEESYEFYPRKGLKIIEEVCEILKKTNSSENLINDINLIRKNLLLQNLKNNFDKILLVMKHLDIDINTNNKRISLRISNLNNINYKEKLIENDDDEENEIKTSTNSIEIKTNNESDKHLIDYDENNNLIKENSFYQKLNGIIGNIKLFRTSVGHNGPLTDEEKQQFYCLLLRSKIIS